jgi:hypothetical protein
MSVPTCEICSEQNLIPSPEALAEGDYCPLCYRPVCKAHLSLVRFRWKASREMGAALICRPCKTAYKHRYWDSAQREWIS